MGHISTSRQRLTIASGALALALTALAVTAPPAHAGEHEVRPGENLTVIARRYGVSAGELARLNGLDDPNHLVVGTRLRLPTGSGGSTTPARSGGSGRGASGGAAAAAPAAETAPAFTITEWERRDTSRLLHRAAREFDVPPSLLKALTYTESRWRQDVVSRSGAIGIGQILPATADWLAWMMDESGLDPASKVDNVRMSARLLRFLIDATGGTEPALAAYYQGIGAVQRDGVSTGGARYAAVITSRQAWFR